MFHLRFLLLILIAPYAMAATEGDALITVAEGKIVHGKDVSGQAVPAFSRLKEGESLTLTKGSRLRVVYFASGRQETWEGPGKLEIGSTGGKSGDLRNGVAVQLPDVLVRQMSKTPVEGGQGRAGMTRLRAIVSPDAVAKVEETYRQLRSATTASDLNPEMYALSAWLEMRAYSRVEQVIGDLRASRSADGQAMELADLYERALRQGQAAAR
jgi:hypothetical protein